MKRTDQEIDRILEQLVASTRSPRGKFSAGASYRKLEKRLPRTRSRILPMRSLLVAASVALLCVVGWSISNYLKPVSIQTISTLAETKVIRLPDHTEVTLNHFSTISYPEHFGSDNREVELKGEAYFEVAKDKRHPFIVQTEAVDVRVLGTHFNIDAYPDDPEVKTTLLEGSVEVSSRSNSDRIILKPNESAIYNKVEKSLNKISSDASAEEISWRHGAFIFNNEPLQEIARQLSNYFGATFTIDDPALKNYKITAKFTENEDLEQILSLLQVAGHFEYKYTKDNNQITVTTKPN